MHARIPSIPLATYQRPTTQATTTSSTTLTLLKRKRRREKSRREHENSHDFSHEPAATFNDRLNNENNLTRNNHNHQKCQNAIISIGSPHLCLLALASKGTFTLPLLLLLASSFLPIAIEASTLDIYKNARLGHRIVQTRYGRLHGLILPLDNFRFLRSVEVFLGVPYATPPTKQNRFSPTRAPAPWDGIRISDKYSPVCPQRLPNIQNETAALEKMPKGRLEYLKRLLPFLENQSEDCLYLNIFSPINAATSDKKLPVFVFIHGESFEWSSGNPYDGSVLASYGEIVVVTLNYRLGILGFLNANPNPQTHARVANYGLMDQMAALHWIQQNIQKFGGDPNAVTLAGHGTGAACINFLMTSPTMVRGLFQRAILMSGSAYSSWALVEDPVIFALKLAREVNCSIPDDLNRHHEEIVDCLREVTLEELYTAPIEAPSFLTSFGPSVDGVVIRSGHSNLDMDDLISRNSKRSSSDSFSYSSGGGHSGRSGGSEGNSGGSYSSGGVGGSGGGYGSGFHYGSGTGSHYDVLFGVVTGESIWRFSAHDIQNGFEGDRRDKIIRTYVRNAYNYHLNEIFYTIVNEYTDWDRTSQHPINTRDTAVAALSDAQFVAPIIRAGDILASQSPPPLPQLPQPPLSTHSGGRQSSMGGDGDGIKTSSSTSSAMNGPRCYFYVFDYQTKDGDYPQRMGTVHGEDLPYIFGAPLVDGFSHFPQNYTKSEIALSEAVIIYWTNFARTVNPNEHHRQDSTLPASKERNRFRSISWENYDPLHQKYLEIGMKPRIKNHFRAHQLSIWLRLIPELHRAGMEDVLARHNLFRNHDNLELYDGLVKPDPFASTRLLLIDESTFKKGHNNNLTGAYMSGVLGVTTMEPSMFTTCIPLGGNYTGGIFAPTTLANASSADTLASGFEAAGYAAYSTALSVTIAIGCSLLILNVLIFAGVYYQRDKTRLEVKTLQKQYQQRSLHQQVAYPPEPIKHAHHYHMGHSQSASVIVDVENHGDQGAMLLTAEDVKQPPPHICANMTMQLMPPPPAVQQQGGGGGTSGSMLTTSNFGSSGTLCGVGGSGSGSLQYKQQQQEQITSGEGGGGSGNLLGITASNTHGNLSYAAGPNTKHQQQQAQQTQAQREHMQLKSINEGSSSDAQTFGRSMTSPAGQITNNSGSVQSVSFNSAGLMTLPKAAALHHSNSINYGRVASAGGNGGGLPIGSGLLTINNGNSGSDCMTLPRNLTTSSRHNLTSDAQYQQQQHQQQQYLQQQLQQQQQQHQTKHQPNGTVMSGLGGFQHHIRAPRPPVRTASSTPSNGGGNGVGLTLAEQASASLNSGISSNGSSSSGVSSVLSSKSHTHHHLHSHQHPSDSIGMTTSATNVATTPVGTISTGPGAGGVGVGGGHLQQQVTKPTMDEMRV